ncbi:MAG: TlpA disulfide reductase family protein [Dehalococcoidia bacterium]
MAHTQSHTGTSRLIAAVIAVALGGLLLVLAFALWRGVGQAEDGRTDAGGAQAAGFTVPLFEGGTFDLADHAGGPVFVYFWASWCLPCIEESAAIERVWPEYRDRGYTFVGVNIWDLETDARRFVEEHALTFPLARDAERSVYVEYGVQGLPTAFFLEPGLRVHSRYDGPLDDATLRTLLDEIEDDEGAGERS